VYVAGAAGADVRLRDPVDRVLGVERILQRVRVLGRKAFEASQLLRGLRSDETLLGKKLFEKAQSDVTRAA